MLHQMIHGFVQGLTAETWIKSSEKRQDGWVEFKALQAHYGVKVDKAVLIKDVGVLRNTLNYNSWNDASFEKFLTNIQYMFHRF